MGIFSILFGNRDNSALTEALQNNPFLVDVRSPAAFASGTVAGAVNIPLELLPTQLSRLKDKKNIVVFCRSGNRSGQAKSLLEQSGFRNVINGGTWENVQQALTAQNALEPC